MTQEQNTQKTEELLKLLSGKDFTTADEFKRLVTAIDSHTVLAKVFLLEGTPYVFKNSPMKYVIFREQVAERFGVGYQDVCIVGSAKLGFSPSPTSKFGKPFQETSDVDVVIISEAWFNNGSYELLKGLNQIGPSPWEVKNKKGANAPKIDPEDWVSLKEAIRNYVYSNFNPGLLPYDSQLRQEVFEKISSTAGLFLALAPQVFVSKIRCRFFKTWKAAENYYSNSLRELAKHLEPNALLDEVEEPPEKPA